MHTRDWYDTPLFYDIIYDADTRKEADLLETVFARHARVRSARARRVLEPACGSGRLVRELTRRGWSAGGFDASDKMLAFARERAPRAILWQDRMERFSVTGVACFDLAHCLINTFRYLLTELEARAFLQRVSGALKPGGLFVLGLHLTDYSRTSCEHERWVMERKGFHVVCNTRTWPADAKARIEKLRTRLAITRKGETRRQETCWDYRTYDAAQLRGLLRRATPELEVVTCHDFTCDAGTERKLDDEYSDVIVVLRKTM